MSASFRLVEIPVQSKLLEGNPLGDPHARTLRLLVPADETDGPFPVIWVLVGYGGTAANLLDEDPWTENFLQRVNRLASEGRLPPAIFAIPDCFTSLGGSQYLDSPAVGPYASHLWKELRPLVEARFPCNGRHGVTGKSSGGYGAWMQAILYPEHVRAIACHSSDMAFEYAYQGAFPLLAGSIRRHGGVEEFFDAFLRAKNKRSMEWFMAIQTLCMAACYSPSGVAPLGIDLPFDPATAAIRTEVWERWLALDPVRMVENPDVAATLRGLDLLFLDCGNRDEYQLHWGLRQLVSKLRIHGVPHEHEEFDDGHRSTSYRYDVSLPKLAQALRS